MEPGQEGDGNNEAEERYRGERNEEDGEGYAGGATDHHVFCGYPVMVAALSMAVARR
jgi:hypothetical protein